MPSLSRFLVSSSCCAFLSASCSGVNFTGAFGAASSGVGVSCIFSASAGDASAFTSGPSVSDTISDVFDSGASVVDVSAETVPSEFSEIISSASVSEDAGSAAFAFPIASSAVTSLSLLPFLKKSKKPIFSSFLIRSYCRRHSKFLPI